MLFDFDIIVLIVFIRSWGVCVYTLNGEAVMAGIYAAVFDRVFHSIYYLNQYSSITLKIKLIQ